MKLNHVNFLKTLETHITNMGLDLEEATLDHIAYQAASSEDYNTLMPQFLEIAELVKEPMVGGRRVGMFKFNTPLLYKGQEIAAIELIEPTQDQSPQSGLEHAEYLFPYTLEELIDKYPQIEFDTSRIDRAEFPMLKLQLTENMQVKFPRKGILAD